MKEFLDLQQKYLETHDSKVLDLLYQKVLYLALHIICSYDHRYEVEDAYTIAEDVVIRLRDRQEIVIRSSASAFVTRALLFNSTVKARKQMPVIDPEAEDMYPCIHDSHPMEDDELRRDVMDHIHPPDDLRPYVIRCIYGQEDMKTVKKSISSLALKARFEQTMEEVRKYVISTYMQG